VVAIISIVKTRKPLIIVPLIAVLVISLMLLPKKFGEGVHLMRTSTIYARFIDSDEGIAVGMQNPLLGVGYNHIRAVKKFADEVSANGYSYSHAGASFHSSYVTILASEGIIGLILFAWMLLSWSRRSEYANYAITFIGILSLTDNVFLYPFVLVFLIITICSNTRDAGRYL
jgi:O-antigen ligase